MRLLLDTHVLLWLFGAGGEVDGSPSPAQRAAVEAPENEILISVATFWEVTLKARVGKLRIDPARLALRCDEAGFQRLPILDPHLAVLATLPFHKDHRDPFDHLLIAQAIAEDLVFLTADRHAARYPVGLLA